MEPIAPPRSLNQATCGGIIGPDPEHFVVEEVPAYLPSGEGEHSFFWVEKIGLNTQDVARRLADVAGVKVRDVGYAGMKDRNAITRQWFSLITQDESAASWDLGEGCRILEVSRHKNKLRTGHLIGNRFRITLVDCPPDALNRALEIRRIIAAQGFPNYFGPQRFGREGRNLSKALTWLTAQVNEGQNTKSQPERDARDVGGERPRGKGRRKGKGRRDSRFDSKLLSSVIQSELFNRYLMARLAHPEPLLLGEVVRLAGTGSHFVVEDVAQEEKRFLAGDLHRTGPMIGPKTLASDDQARALEEKVIEELGLDEGARLALGRHAPGSRRDLMLDVEELEIHEEEEGLVFEFCLPKGAYATVLMREFSGAAWDSPRAEPPRISFPESHDQSTLSMR